MPISPESIGRVNVTVAELRDVAQQHAGRAVIVVIRMSTRPGSTRRERHQAEQDLVTEVLLASSLLVRRIDLIERDDLEVPTRLEMVCDADSGAVLWDARTRHLPSADSVHQSFQDPEDQISHLTRAAKVISFWT
jgi:hypothetical protein